jgi:hypothetical protein
VALLRGPHTSIYGRTNDMKKPTLRIEQQQQPRNIQRKPSRSIKRWNHFRWVLMPWSAEAFHSTLPPSFPVRLPAGHD